jgi:DNA-binding transcriptional LysR family regulator
MPERHESPVELRHLRYFVAIADAGTVTLAARHLNISQPTLSRQLHDLEEDLGVRLFARVGRRLQLTSEGTELLARTRRVLGDIEGLRARAKAMGGAAASVVRVGAPSLPRTFLAEMLRRHARRHPNVELALVSEGTEQHLALLRQGRLHLALGIFRDVPSLDRRLLYPTCMLAVVPRAHRLVRRRSVTPADLASERLLIMPRGIGIRYLVDAMFCAGGVEPRVGLETPSPEIRVRLVRQGRGVAIVSSSAPLDRAGIRAIPVLHDGRPVGTWAAVVWDPRRDLPSAAEDLIETLVAVAKDHYPGRAVRETRLVPRPPAS